MDFEKTIYQLILHGGNARGEAYEALDAAEQFDFATAEKHLEEAERELAEGHKWQTSLIQSDSKSEAPVFLMIHAQDHLMTALAELNLVKRFLANYKMMASLDERVKKLEEK